LEEGLLLQDEMILAKLLKNIVATRQQFDQGQYPTEAYESAVLWQVYFKKVNEINAGTTDTKQWEAFRTELLSGE